LEIFYTSQFDPATEIEQLALGVLILIGHFVFEQHHALGVFAFHVV